jgi:hypothetical protein
MKRTSRRAATALAVVIVTVGLSSFGHAVMADAPVERLAFTVKPDVALRDLSPAFCWFHPRMAAIPGMGQNGQPRLVMTLQKHLKVSDYYSGLYVMQSDDLGKTWTGPTEIPELGWVKEPGGAVVAVADVTPGWHAPTGKLIAIGAKVRYSPRGEQLGDKSRSSEAAYAVHDPKTGAWSRWKILEMPRDKKFDFVCQGCSQWLIQADGSLLVALYCGESDKVPWFVTVAQCTFDGETLRYVKHGDEISLTVERGLVEPQLAFSGGRYYLSLRNDVKGYVTVGDDGLHFEPTRPWTFDDGKELGSYNTQQHWLTRGDGLFLAYTRRGANNDHIARNRAPLFLAQVDPKKLCVLRDTEKVVVPERGVDLGNFGASPIDANRSVITVGEFIVSDKPDPRGADGSLFTSWITWDDAAAATSIGPGPQLFVDDVLVARRTGLTRRAHACNKLDAPVLQAEKPWEEQRVYVYGTAHYDAQADRFLLWYMAHGSDPSRWDERLRGSDLILFATSKDGVAWRRPNVGQFTFDGNTANNIVSTMHSPSVLVDVDEPNPTYRYKMLGHRRDKEKHGYWAAFSSDGLRWTPYPKNPILPGGDTITLSYNPKTREYLAYFKRPTEVRGYRRRVVYLATSKDMQNWSEAGVVMAPDEEDDRWVQSPEQRTEFYNMSVFPRGDQFLGLVTVFKLERIMATTPAKEQSRHDGPIEVQLAHSRDGRKWYRCDDRRPVIPRGPHAYDAGGILGLSNIPVIHNDQMWMYYTAMTTTHGGALPEKRLSVARAAWPLDRMVSLDAGAEEGLLETVPLKFAGRRLWVNADASAGQLVVEVLDRDGQVLPGYAAKDCTALRGDAIRHSVSWAGGKELPSGRPLRLRFQPRNTSLFSFDISP